MPTNHTIQQGECLASVAIAQGYFWKDLWNAPENKTLRNKRSNPHLLQPGDVLVLPDKTKRSYHCPTEARHRFQVKGIPVWLRLQILDNGHPRANEPYLLKIEADGIRGKTDAEGRLQHQIPPDTTHVRLRLGPDTSGEDYILKIGHLDPVNEVSGAQARLNNLGFACGEIDGKLGRMTRKALNEFQAAHDLPLTGQLDQPTQDKLTEVHGS